MTTPTELARRMYELIRALRPPNHVMPWEQAPTIAKTEYLGLAGVVCDQLGLPPCRACERIEPGRCEAEGCIRIRRDQ